MSEREQEPKLLGQLIEQIFGLRVSRLPQSDAEWDERERRLAEENARPSDTENHDRAMSERKRARLLEACGCPPKRVDEALANAYRADAPAVLALRGFPENEETGGVRVLSGGVGTGKTVAAVRWLFERGGARPLFLRAKALEAAGSFDKELRAQWAQCSAMVLDDLGVEYADERGVFLSNLDEVLDHFAGSRSPLVITTNLLPEPFRERYKERVTSRLRQLQAWNNVKGPDMRRGQR